MLGCYCYLMTSGSVPFAHLRPVSEWVSLSPCVCCIVIAFMSQCLLCCGYSLSVAGHSLQCRCREMDAPRRQKRLCYLSEWCCCCGVCVSCELWSCSRVCEQQPEGKKSVKCSKAWKCGHRVCCGIATLSLLAGFLLSVHQTDRQQSVNRCCQLNVVRFGTVLQL